MIIKFILLLFIIILILIFYFINNVNNIIKELIFDIIKTYNNISKKKINKKKYINYVCNKIKFYKKYKNYDLKNFPIVNKIDIRENPDLFLNKDINLLISSKDTANNAWVDKKEKSIDNFNLFRIYNLIIKVFYNNYAICQITGGTSNQYFYQWYTKNELILGSYGFLKCFFNLGYNFNDKILLYYGHASNTVKIINYLNFLSSNYNFKSLVPKKNKNDFSLNHVYKFLNILNSYKPKLIIAFPSHIFRIAQLIWINNIELQYTPYCMDLSAEFLFTCQYKFIKEIFKNCDIRLSYGTVEFGQIAQQTKEDIRLYEVFDEIVDIRNNEKNQFIITSYILTTQPLINYLVDDYGIVFKKNGKTYIKNLVGKKSKCLTDDKFDLIKIDNIINKINKIELIIIDVKIKYLSKKIHIIILKNINNKKKKYIKSQFIDNLGINNNYNFIFDLCLNYKCPNIVNFNIKVNAIICE